jgi:glycosyltransferase involved in cell wall biosynthesis
MNDWLEKGEAFFADGKIEEAQKCFRTVVEENPENREAWNNLGVIAYRKRDTQAAADYFLKSLQIDPLQIDAIANLCELLAASGNLGEGLPLLETLAEKNPDNPDIAKLLSQARLADDPKALPQEVTALYDRAGTGRRIEIGRTADKESEGPHRLETKKPAAVVEEPAKSVIETTSPDPMALLKEGFARFSERSLDEAAALFRQVVRLDPRSKEAHNNLGVIAFEKKDYQEAVGHFATALQLDPTYVDARKNLDAARKQISLSALEVTESITEKDTRELLKGVRLAIVNSFDNKFNGIYRSYFSQNNDVRVVRPETEKDLKETVEWADLVWSTWCNEPLVFLSGLKKSAKIVTHIRSYEILTPQLMQGVNWQNMDGAIFVAHHIRELANKAWTEQLTKLPQTTVYNCIELDKYPFYENGPGRNVCYVGYLNHKKGIGLLLQCIREAVTNDPSYHFHIAGDFQEARFEVYMRHLIMEMNLTDHITFHGWVKDVPEFLGDMNYVISTSPWEGCPYNVIEAMACGIKPLVHNWNGARTLFSDALVFNSVPGFMSLLTSSNYDSRLYRKIVETDFNAERNLPQIDTFLSAVLSANLEKLRQEAPPSPKKTGLLRETREMTKAAVTTSATGQSTGWQFADAIFSHYPGERLKALLAEARKQVSKGREDLAEVSLARAALMSGHDDETVIEEQVRLYRSSDNIPAIQKAMKRSSLAALEKGDLNNFLHRAYLSIYAENLFGRKPNYQHSVVDEDFNVYIRLAARSHPLYQWVREHAGNAAAGASGDRLRIGFVLEGFSERQASARNYYPLAEHHDPDRFDLYFYSRWFMGEDLAKQHGYQNTARNLEKWGCHVRTPERRLGPMDQVDFLAKSIVNDRIDILVFQTAYFVPQHNFVSCLHPAPFQASLEAQQPEYSHEMDLIFTTRKQIPECYTKTAPFVIMTTREKAAQGHQLEEFGIPNSATILITVHRGVRYNQPIFWTQMEKVLSRNSQVYLMAVGPTEEEVASMETILPSDPSVRKRIVMPGYRSDIMELLAMSDVYVDLFPSGGGSAVIEAMQAGLPIVCIDQDYGTLFSVNSVSLAPGYMDDHELVVPHGDLQTFHQKIDKVIADKEWRLEIGRRMMKRASMYRPDKVAASFFHTLATEFEARYKRQEM